MSALEKTRVVHSPLSNTLRIARFGKDPTLALEARDAEVEILVNVARWMCDDTPRGASKDFSYGGEHYRMTVLKLDSHGGEPLPTDHQTTGGERRAEPILAASLQKTNGDGGMTDTAREAAIEHFRERCASCGAFMNTSHPGTAWAACGEFGEETEYTCHRCTARPTFRLIAGNGTSDPRWCGYVNGGLHQPTGAEPVAAAALRDEPEQKDQSW